MIGNLVDSSTRAGRSAPSIRAKVRSEVRNRVKDRMRYACTSRQRVGLMALGVAHMHPTHDPQRAGDQGDSQQMNQVEGFAKQEI